MGENLNNKFMSWFYEDEELLEELEPSELDDMTTYPGGMSVWDRAVDRLELEHEVVRAQWHMLIDTYKKAGLSFPEMPKMQRLLAIADKRDVNKTSNSRVDNLSQNRGV